MEKKNYAWEQKYLIAKKYYEKNGTLIVNANSKNEEERQLGMWLSTQRSAYKSKLKIGNSKIKPLTDEQVKLLNEIGMIWDKGLYNYSNKKIDRSIKRAVELKAYKFLKKYAVQIKNEIETHKDIENINDVFCKTLGQLKK